MAAAEAVDYDSVCVCEDGGGRGGFSGNSGRQGGRIMVA